MSKKKKRSKRERKASFYPTLMRSLAKAGRAVEQGAEAKEKAREARHEKKQS